jgi:hypothetical protein
MVRLLEICTHTSSLAPREPESQTRGEDAASSRAGLWIKMSSQINSTLFARGKPVFRQALLHDVLADVKRAELSAI